MSVSKEKRQFFPFVLMSNLKSDALFTERIHKIAVAIKLGNYCLLIVRLQSMKYKDRAVFLQKYVW